jgi:hypothetical protein
VRHMIGLVALELSLFSSHTQLPLDKTDGRTNTERTLLKYDR